MSTHLLSFCRAVLHWTQQNYLVVFYKYRELQFEIMKKGGVKSKLTSLSVLRGLLTRGFFFPFCDFLNRVSIGLKMVSDTSKNTSKYDHLFTMLNQLKGSKVLRWFMEEMDLIYSCFLFLLVCFLMLFCFRISMTRSTQTDSIGS